MDVDRQTLNTHDESIATSNKYKIVQSTLSKVALSDMMNDPNAINKLPFKFNHVLQEKVAVTNQFNSGRCWVFAALNVIRHAMIQKYKLPDNFQLSQAYIYKYDQIEKCNTALHLIYYYSKNGGTMSLECLTLVKETCSDGGTIDFFMNIINKYGIVPYDVYPDNTQSKNTSLIFSPIS